MSSFSGDGKLDSMLEDKAKKLATGLTKVSVGFFESAVYPDGTSVAMVAAVNEFGGTITVPEHSVTLNRKLLKNGTFAKGGQFVKKSKANFSSTHTVPSYTIKIPSRPFFRSMVNNLKGDVGPLIAHLMKEHDYDVEKVLKIVGNFAKEKLEDSIRTFAPTGNAPSTIRNKGFDHPLIHTSVMLNSVGVELE